MSMLGIAIFGSLFIGAIYLGNRVYKKERIGEQNNLYFEASAISYITGEPLEDVLKSLALKEANEWFKEQDKLRIKQESLTEKACWNPPVKITPSKNFVGSRNDYKGLNQIKMRR